MCHSCLLLYLVRIFKRLVSLDHLVDEFEVDLVRHRDRIELLWVSLLLLLLGLGSHSSDPFLVLFHPLGFPLLMFDVGLLALFDELSDRV